MAAEPETKRTVAITKDVLVLDGGSTEVLAYHIGFVTTLIAHNKISTLDQVIGTGPSALLAARLAWAWPQIVDVMNAKENRRERSDRLMAVLCRPFDKILCTPQKDWKPLIEALVKEHETSPGVDVKTDTGEVDLVADAEVEVASQASSEWRLSEVPKAFVCSRVFESSQLNMVLADHPIDALAFACGLPHGPVRHTTVFNNLWTAMRCVATRSGVGIRFIVSTVSCTPDMMSTAVTLSDVECYTMDDCVAKCGLFGSTTVLTPGRVGELRLKGHADCKQHFHGSTAASTRIHISLMQTPRKKTKRRPATPRSRQQKGWCSAWCAAKRGDNSSGSSIVFKHNDNDREDEDADDEL